MQKIEKQINGIRFPVYSLNTLVIGSGAASLNAAVCLDNFGQTDVAVVTDNRGGGTSNNAGSDKQTYYKLSLSGHAPDSPHQMAEDLFRGGCMHGDIALCEASHSAEAFHHLVGLGVPFPQSRFGEHIGYLTDHDSIGRGASAGPMTSQMMFAVLSKEVERRSITVLKRHEVIALLTEMKGDEKHVIGAIALNLDELQKENCGFVVFNAVNVILGTGGPAGMYETSVYPESQTGSTGLALRIGAVAQNLTESQFGLASIKFRWNVSGSYQQVMPRYYSTDQDGSDEREFLNDYFPDLGSLVSAIFLKGYQWPFDVCKVADHGSSLLDLLVYNETVIKGRRVFLDFTRNPGGGVSLEDFRIGILSPAAFEYLRRSDAILDTPIGRLQKLNQPAVNIFRKNGIDLTAEPLEIAVCAQHNNGGLRGNIWWESNIRHLFPVGEVNGTHGVYRPGGAALNAGQVGGLRAAMYIAKQYGDVAIKTDDFIRSVASQFRDTFTLARRMIDKNVHAGSLPDFLDEIQTRMSQTAGIIRNAAQVKRSLTDAWRLLERLSDELRAASAEDLPQAFKILDLCLTHAIYLEAIAGYFEKGGRSRGAFILSDPQGEKPCLGMSDQFRFRLNEVDAFVDHNIQEIRLDENFELKTEWVDIRPVPATGLSFEKAWKEFREDDIFS